jgi:hypothetical protein
LLVTQEFIAAHINFLYGYYVECQYFTAKS